MKWLIQIISIITIMTGTSMAQNLYNFSINDIDGNVINFNEFQGKPILLVNTASRCGFTKQYANLIIISTPSNSFKQELSEEEDVKEFCLVNYQTKFILTEIIDVKGDNAHPLYQWIANDYGKTPKWNFYKYLFDGQGNLVESWSSMTKPDSKKITDQIDRLI
jgi:glutathione peroxidase